MESPIQILDQMTITWKGHIKFFDIITEASSLLQQEYFRCHTGQQITYDYLGKLYMKIEKLASVE